MADQHDYTLQSYVKFEVKITIARDENNKPLHIGGLTADPEDMKDFQSQVPHHQKKEKDCRRYYR